MSMRNVFSFLLLLLVGLAQTQEMKIFGTIFDTNKKPVPNWTVVIYSNAATASGAVKLQTNADGNYEHVFALDGKAKEYTIQVIDPCARAPQEQKAPAVEGEFRHDFVICATQNPGGDPCDGRFTMQVLQDGWVVFQASSTSKTAEFYWDFGDGTTDKGQSVKHQYAKEGVYLVTLTIVNTNCKKQYQQKVEIVTVTPPPPPAPQWDNACCGKVHISASPSPTNAGSYYIFTASAAFPIKEVSWDFGDGTTATGIEVKHAYSAAGKYKVVTTITGEFCKVELTTWITVGPNPSPCAVDFNFTTDQLTVKFVPDFKGSKPDKVRWDFGDGSSSSDEIVAHTYGRPGVYKVTLYISINGVECHITKEVKVGVKDPNGPCNADFKFFIDQFTVKFEPNFNGQTVDKLLWNFGDGESSSDAFVKHTYAKEGTYNVVLYYVINGIECKVGKVVRIGKIGTGGRLDITIYEVSPNPALEDLIISVKSSQKAAVTLLISDLTNTTVYKQPVELEAGDNRIAVPVKNLKPGTYLIYIYFENDVVARAKFQKI